MNKYKKISEESFVYLYTTIQHFKRVHKFLNSKDYKNAYLVIIFIKKEKDLELLKSNIKTINNKFLKIRFIHLLDNNLINQIKILSHNRKLNILVDRITSELEFKVCGKLYKSKDLKIIFIEHNLNFHWDYVFDHKSGYKKKEDF